MPFRPVAPNAPQTRSTARAKSSLIWSRTSPSTGASWSISTTLKRSTPPSTKMNLIASPSRAVLPWRGWDKDDLAFRFSDLLVWVIYFEWTSEIFFLPFLSFSFSFSFSSPSFEVTIFSYWSIFFCLYPSTSNYLDISLII